MSYPDGKTANIFAIVKNSGKIRNFELIMATKNNDKSKYYLYIDECGDQNLENFNPSFPIFTLCGILVSRENNRKLEDEFNSLNKHIFISRSHAWL